MDPRVDAIVTHCTGTPEAPHPFVLFADRRTAPRPCPICGRVSQPPLNEEASR